MRNRLLGGAAALALGQPCLAPDDAAASSGGSGTGCAAPAPADEMAERRTVQLGVARRAAEPRSYDPESRTVELVAATGFPVRRYDWDDGPYLEQLRIEGDSVDLSRVGQGVCPLLDSHQSYSLESQLGIVESGRIENGQLLLSVRFADTERAREVEAEVAAGRLRGVSIGYRRDEIAKGQRQPDQIPTHTITRWTLFEVSLVPIPADPDAGVRSDQGSHPCAIISPHETRDTTDAIGEAPSAREDDTMRNRLMGGVAAIALRQPNFAPDDGGAAAGGASTPAPAQPATPSPAEEVRQAAITPAQVLDLTQTARSLGVEDAAATALRAPNASVESVNAAVLAAAAARQQANTGAVPAGMAARDSGSDVTARRQGIEGAILHGLRTSRGERNEPDAIVQPYLRHGLSELAALSLGEREMPRSAAERVQVFERAFHSTSDFPILLSGALNQRLEQNYQVAAPTYRRIARQMTFADFRPHDVLRPGDFPQLQQVGEGGEIRFGTIGEKRETVAVRAYGIQFALTRQLLVNDNLGAIDQILASQGISVALFEEKTFYAMKGTIGPVLIENGRAVYHTTNGNLAASGAAINDTSLSDGRAALRKQKNLQGDAMNLTPRLLLVSPDKETEAQKAVAPVNASQTSHVNIFAGSLEVVVAGQLTGNAWELYADPAFGTNWTWGLLDGFTAPRLRLEERFGQQGVGVSLEHDFGCGAVDFRFGYRNAGN